METEFTVFFVFITIAGIFLYFLPGLIAGKRKHKYSLLITILNFFLGWTIFGWLGLLVWALIDTSKTGSVDELKTLADLKEKGVITEEEFEQKKKNLMDKI